MSKTLMLMLKMKFFWLIFRGKFEQKTQKSICLQNQWKLKNINKAIVVKNIISNKMFFTKSIFDQFWRSYHKKSIFPLFTTFWNFCPYICAYHPGWNDDGSIAALDLLGAPAAWGHHQLHLHSKVRWGRCWAGSTMAMLMTKAMVMINGPQEQNGKWEGQHITDR